ncbi:MAG: hypothetical protein JKY61_07140 [Planctomycetes bacterium]|nr:hypothetical protein [Planctomycetota bacterium]
MFIINLGIAGKGQNCEAAGGKHVWYNQDGRKSACYHCKVTRLGRLWETEQEFQRHVNDALEPHSQALISVLRQLVLHDYPHEVVSVEFEVFPQSFPSGFPVRAFFMDKDNTEFFISKDGAPAYPSPVDPELLELSRVYRADAAKDLLDADPDADDLTLAGEALIPWFSRCWLEAGGAVFTRSATISLHDGGRFFDLVEQNWQGW